MTRSRSAGVNRARSLLGVRMLGDARMTSLLA
jgi:hypothetical protein